MHTYEVRPCKDHRGVDLISDALPFGRLWYAGAERDQRNRVRETPLPRSSCCDSRVRASWLNVAHEHR